MPVGAGPAAPAPVAVLPDGSTVHVRTTTRADGDLQIDLPAEVLAARRRAVADRPWVWLRQVHGAEVVTARGDVAHLCGRPADAAVTAEPGIVLAVHTADCAPIALWSPEGVVGAVHAGWRGLAAGVVEAAVAAMRDLGATEVAGWLGPCIRAECYEFGDGDLARIADDLGPAVVGRTAEGHAALDLPAAVVVATTRAGVARLDGDGGCTRCGRDRWFSHRGGDVGRQATLVWREPAS